ncbi:MAG: helix-turn-helix domain-containing protein [Sphingobacterium sp.]|jgi:transcriptional regulator with XRE-family HTH domain|uniref:helix-turn-helix domain-containing protein n=1 Tax=unclassified Sphingobacterium TaxID=2609468 RepID=UPI002850F449|nr:helix-turn-helix domain-containing protein [Sphingobacterium sp.]MDR3008054.1 helix-turn-helix domain-containing protein [Sphingobacterium sp.]
MTNKSNKEKIALLVKNARIQRGYSQQQLADLVKLNLRSVQRIEKAEVLPRVYNLNLIAEQLDLDIALLLAEVSYIPETSDAEQADQIHNTVNKPRKLILSIGLGLIGMLLIAAFLSQSSSFPETSFELFLMLTLVVAIYATILWYIWRS